VNHDTVIFDLELTAWEGSLARNWSGPGEFREIVQIGAVRLSGAALSERLSFNLLVKPDRNPILSEYFTELTGITNEALAASGVPFASAYEAFCEFSEGARAWAYGADTQIVNENIALHGLAGQVPLFEGETIAPWFAAQGVDIGTVNSGRLAAEVGGTSAGAEHNALADARSIAEAARVLIAQGASNPFSPR